MRVKDLVTKLQQYDQECEVSLEQRIGYSQGFPYQYSVLMVYLDEDGYSEKLM